MQFYLMSNGERSVITDDPMDDLDGGWSTCGEVEAESWLDAKAALGFELTTLQQAMLPLDAAGRQTLQRRSGNATR